MRILLLALTFPLPAFAGDTPEGLEIGHGWMAASGGGDARVYIRMHNETGQDLVIGAITSDLGEAELVAPPLGGGDPVALGDYPLAADEELEMAPGAVHVVIHDAGPMAEGTEFEVEITLDPLGSVTAEVDVESADAESESHVGHDH